MAWAMHFLLYDLSSFCNIMETELPMTLFEKLKNLKLLLIDDDEWIRDSMRLFFENEGCTLVTLETAEQAIELVKTRPFDIIFSDFRLPGLNGIELFKHIIDNHRPTVKILLTAHKNQSVSTDAQKAGIHEIIEKPFTPEIIESVLTRLISHLF